MKANLLESRRLLSFVLIGAFLWSLLNVNWARDLVHPGGWEALRQIVLALFQTQLSPDILSAGVQASWTTIAYAVTGMTLAIAIGLPLGVIASGVLTRARW
ncbi:MAG: ABC transporter permease, partial [Chloroflexota bacterium]